MNSKIYKIYEYPGYKVGVTYRTLQQRDKENRRAFKKRGITLPDIVLLETSEDVEYVKEREIELQITKGYRVDHRNYKHSLIGNRYAIKPEARKKRNKSWREGYLKSEKRIEDLKKSYKKRVGLAKAMGKVNRKAVKQICKKTNKVINIFESTQIAGKALNTVPEAIQLCAKLQYNPSGLRKSSAGFYWEYV